MNNEERILKNMRIAKTKRETVERHKSMLVKTFEVKIQDNKISPLQREALHRIFLEQKWYKNYILNWCEQSPENKISKFDTKINEITKKDKDMRDVSVRIRYLSAQSRQCLVSRMISNIKTLKTLKDRNLQRCGKLKFSKEENIIDLKQYGVSHKILSSKRIRIAGLPKTFIVNGLKQFINTPLIEYANARLIRRGTGYYVQFVCYVPKEKVQEKMDIELGIDFGCETSFTLSNGEKLPVKVPESERLKKCQKSMAHKKKGSKNWCRELSKVRKEYQRIVNRKNDLANKVVAKVCQYKTVVIQDEQIKAWHKGGHGRAVQYSVLGKVKAKLIQKDNVVVLNRFVPTTKLCINCGIWHDELKLSDRVFRCSCGVNEDRDIHAAKNMLWFYKNGVGVGRTKFKRVEMESLVSSIIGRGSQVLSGKHEASAL